jgi:hypothetical protein
MEVFYRRTASECSLFDAPVCLGSLTQFTDLSVPVTGVLNGCPGISVMRHVIALESNSYLFHTGQLSGDPYCGKYIGMYDTLTIPYTIYPIPVANAGSDTGLCRNSSVLLMAMGGGTYEWNRAQ